MHLSPTGLTCGRPDGHNGQCYSVEVMARRRAARATPEGRKAANSYKRRTTPEERAANNEASRRSRSRPGAREAANESSRRTRITPGRVSSKESSRRVRSTTEGREATRAACRHTYAKNPESTFAAARRRKARLAGFQQEEISRVELFERQRGRCYICGTAITVATMHIEHVIPIASPSKVFRRLAASCQPCNNGIGGKHRKLLAPYLLERWNDGRNLNPEYEVCLRVCPLWAMMAA